MIKPASNIYIIRSAFALQQNEIVTSRYDQISGIFMHIKFLDNQVNYIQVDTNAASIYFVYDTKAKTLKAVSANDGAAVVCG